MGISIFVMCSLCFCSVFGYNTYSYKAAMVDVAKGDVHSGRYADVVYDAAKLNVDVVVLPSPKDIPSEGALELCMNELDNYDEIVKSVSTAAKDGQVYVVVHLYEKTHCQDKQELIRSNLVFDRHGAIVSVYRKPLNTLSKCNTTMLKSGRFTTDFGVTFGILMEEDILLNNAREFDGIKNFILAGSFVPKTSFLFAKQLPSSWAYVNNVNLITANGIFGGNIDLKSTPKQLIVAEFNKEARNDVPRPLTVTPDSFSTGDLSQYSIKPLDLDASSQGYTDTVCQGTFCCQFYVKANLIGSKQDVTYGLVAFDGTQQLGANYIGVQTCSVVACAGLYKRSCFVGSESNSTNVKFEKISINGNFSEDNSAQFPSILTSTQNVFKKENFKFTIQNKNFKYATAELYKKDNVLSFGIFGRVYSRDYDTSEFGRVNNTDCISDFSEYITSENVQEFFDYLWIRLRIVIFIVSIYVLEMM